MKSNPSLLLCDYDEPSKPPCFESLRKIFNVLPWLRPLWVRYDRTRHGWHVVIQLPRAIHPAATVALQAILGSDPRRETLNLMRALAEPKGLGASHWNILFREKL